MTQKIRIFLILISLGIPALILGAVNLQPWVDPKWMYFDFLTAAEFSDDCCHVYYGFMSNLGIFLWIATSAVCLFSAIILFQKKTKKDLATFALLGGVLSGVLGFDDAFLVHETIMPELGVPQFAVLMVYLILGLAYAFVSRKIIFQNEFWILGLAAIGVGGSLFIDQVYHSIESGAIIAEDSAKFFGIFNWFLFHVVTLLAAFLTEPKTAQ